MQSVRGEHLLSPLIAHQREEIDPRGAGTCRLFARDLVEALDGARDGHQISETGSRRRERPVRLRQRDNPCARGIVTNALVYRAELAPVPIIARSTNDVVRSD